MEDTLEKNELTSLEKLVRQQAEVIGNMQELVQDIVQKQNSLSRKTRSIIKSTHTELILPQSLKGARKNCID